MTIELARQINHEQFFNPSDYKKIFNTTERDKIEGGFDQLRERPAIGVPGESCKSNIFLGFFFDGTRNNYALSEQAGNFTHSNVARLFDAYPGQTIAPLVMLNERVKWPDEAKYPNYFRIYTPGVGTPFDEVRDSGKGVDRTLGAATALWGERRLTWALAQAVNAVHRFFRKVPLLNEAEIVTLARQTNLDAMSLKAPPVFIDGGTRAANAKALWKQVLLRLHDALRNHKPDPTTGRPLTTDPGIVKEIYVSAFGFSRGATAARVFTKWFLALCDLDAVMLKRPGRSLGGFPVTFDFLGVFDTVASVGTAASAIVANGHSAWADAEVSLRVPNGVKCTHLVSAHEVRRSFPLDSISVGGTLPSGCKEIVFPGVHSDIGGGYAPREQGRGMDTKGSDLLSRIPLAIMYREARLAGVPLKLERCRTFVKERFLIDKTLIDDFNAYIAASPSCGSVLRDIMRSQMQMAILWRKNWAGRVGNMPSVCRSAQEDANDLVGADKEFEDEVRQFKLWQEHKAKPNFKTICPNLAVCVEVESVELPGLDPERFIEWEAIEKFWKDGTPPPIARFLENYIHDSRAWFKLTGWEANEVEAGLKEWSRRYDKLLHLGINPHNRFEPSNPLSPEEIDWIEQYRKTGKIPPMKTQGREPFELGAGYLRYRRIYGGGDRLLLTRDEETNSQTRVA